MSEPTFAQRWRDAWSDPRFRLLLALVAAALIALLIGYARFLVVNELREGVQLRDLVLDLIAPVDLTWLTYGLINIALLTGLFFLAGHPRQLLVGLTAYTVMIVVRIAMMLVTPLAPPAGFIPLVDPTVEFFGTGATINRDLFFSGHTSTIVLLFLLVRSRWLRLLFLVCAIAVAGAVLVQHVHYTVDVLVAPFAAFGCLAIARWVLNLPRSNSPGGDRGAR